MNKFIQVNEVLPEVDEEQVTVTLSDEGYHLLHEYSA